MNNENKTPKKNILDRTITTREVIFMFFVVLCLSPLISPPIALLMGLIIAQFVGHPYLSLNHKATHILLQVSVVGLGFGMNVDNALKAGTDGFYLTLVSLAIVILLGFLLGKLLRLERHISFLITCGTAICGGSAIATIAPILKSSEKQISIALGTVFILNSVALVVFPYIGTYLNLSQTHFGLWCAIAIHDTSSVVGAAEKYGNEALEIATTVKLARALWIIPLALLSTFVFKSGKTKIKIPYFIGFFIVAMLINTYVPNITTISSYLTSFAKATLTLTLFLIGCGLSRKVVGSVGYKPLVHGLTIWLVISIAALWTIITFV